jgi:hypothetical protein
LFGSSREVVDSVGGGRWGMVGIKRRGGREDGERTTKEAAEAGR